MRDQALTRAERLEARDRLVTGNLRLVVTIAGRFQHRGLPLTDLIAIGNIGLIRSLRRYDSTRTRLSSYAGQWIRATITRAIAEQTRTIRVPPRLYWIIGHYRRREAALTQEVGRRPTEAEVLDAMHLKPGLRRLIADALAVSRAGSLGEISPTDRAGESAEDAATRSESAARLHEILRHLPHRHAEILRRHHGLGHTYEEIGRDLGVTRERVRQLIVTAMAEARAIALSEHGGTISGARRAARVRLRGTAA